MIFRALLLRLLLLLVPVLAGLYWFAGSSDDIVGNWYTENSEAVVEIFEKDGLYHGKVIHLSEPLYKQGNPKTDKKNHDPKLRNRPQLGLLILYNLVFNPAKHRWEKGKVYVPSLGTEANVVVYMEKKDNLKLRAFVGNEKLGQTQTWTRKK